MRLRLPRLCEIVQLHLNGRDVHVAVAPSYGKWLFCHGGGSGRLLHHALLRLGEIAFHDGTLTRVCRWISVVVGELRDHPLDLRSCKVLHADDVGSGLGALRVIARGIYHLARIEWLHGRIECQNACCFERVFSAVLPPRPEDELLGCDAWFAHLILRRRERLGLAPGRHVPDVIFHALRSHAPVVLIRNRKRQRRRCACAALSLIIELLLFLSDRLLLALQYLLFLLQLCLLCLHLRVAILLATLHRLLALPFRHRSIHQGIVHQNRPVTLLRAGASQDWKEYERVPPYRLAYALQLNEVLVGLQVLAIVAHLV